MVIHNPLNLLISVIINDVSPFAHHWNMFGPFDVVMLRNSYCMRNYDIPN
jgi:hypothetical protein